MSLTNTPSQGFSLAQLGDRPDQLPLTFGQLAQQADIKAEQLDLDAARANTPAVVKISCSLGYLSANDTGSSPIGPQFDTIEYNHGTPTDLTVTNGLTLYRGLYLIGLEVVTRPVASFGNNFAIYASVSAGSPDPDGGNGWALRADVSLHTETVGFPNLFSSLIWGFPFQYMNTSQIGIAQSDGCTVKFKGIFNIDVPYMALWAVQLGDW